MTLIRLHWGKTSFTEANSNIFTAGNRWHLNCFRCNTCGTLLDSDANLLLLGDGSLICNNCTYSCSACGEKIEDLAILTGDQAFCAACFRCRNCKRKIENLRYARTSQGIFCMNCHESLMARRRKKSKAAAQAKAREKDSSPMIVEKSLPALPPNAIPPNAFSNDRVEPDSDTPTELSPRPRPSYPRNDSSRSSSRPARSPERSADHAVRDGGLLPSQTYRNNRNSAIFAGGDIAGSNAADDQSFFIPVALDPSPVPAPTPRSATEPTSDSSKKSKDKDYFNLQKPASISERREPAQSSATPHIAFQEKGRQSSFDHETPPPRDLGRKLSKSSRSDKNAPSKPSPASTEERGQKMTNGKSHPADDFKLQEAPKSKKTNSRTESASNAVQDSVRSRGSSSSSGRKDKEAFPNLPLTDSPQLLQTGEKTGTPRSSQESRLKDDDEVRSNDSLPTSVSNNAKPITRKELPATAARNRKFIHKACKLGID